MLTLTIYFVASPKILDFLTATQVLSHTVIFLLHFISSNPEVQEKIFHESASLSDNPSLEELNKAHFTRAVIQESFRVTSLPLIEVLVALFFCIISRYHPAVN